MPHGEVPVSAEDVPTKAERKVLEWVAGIAAVLITTGLIALFTILWAMHSTQIRMEETLNGFTKRLDSMEVRLSDGTSKRYTSDNAAVDRAGVMDLISGLIKRNDAQDEELSKLREFKARAEERLKINP